MPNITIAADGTEERIQLEAAIVTLGRGLESDVRLKDIKSSRRHCQIVKTTDGFKVVDLGSGNGTLVNGAPIKEHKLRPGDKIQIGATVITYDDGAATRAVAKPAATTATGSTRRETRSMPAPGKSATAKIATSSQPRPAAASTVKTGAMKISGAHPAGSKSTTASKGHTSRVLKSTAHSPTSLSRAQTGKISGATKRTPSASQRFQVETSRKKVNPIAVALGVCGAIVVIAIGAMIFGGGPGDDSRATVLAKINKILTKAAEAEEANDYEAAIKLYETALKDIEGRDAFKGEIQDIRGRIAGARQQMGGVDEANKRWMEFKGLYQGSTPEGQDSLVWYQELMGKAQKLKADYGGANLPWLTELTEYIEKLHRLIDTQKAINEREDFQGFRNALNERCKGQPGKALKAWKEEYLPKAKPDVIAKVQSEIERLTNDCKQATYLAKRNASAKDDKAEAAATIRKAITQVEGSDFEAELREELKKYE